MLAEEYTETILLPDYMSKKRVIIVGAGISGLSCAEQLQKLNFRDVKILEASDRIGGRLYTFGCKKNMTNAGWNYMEIGAQRVIGGTSLYRIAENTQQIDAAAPTYAKALENFRTVYDENETSAISVLRGYFARRLCLPKTFDDILADKEFIKLLDESGCLAEHIRRLVRGYYHWWYCMAYEYTFNSKQVELNYGYSGIMHAISKKLSKNTISANKEVVKIDWTDFQNLGNIRNPSIKIHCRDETSFEADHVIITVPLGYLKENIETLFVPNLPEDKVQAIKSLNFITVNKIYLTFEEVFWNPTDVYHVIWSEKFDQVFHDHKHDNSQDPINWVKHINRFEYVHTNPKTLCAWVWGEGAIIMETLSKEEIACCCMRLLKSLLKKPLPDPKIIDKSSWYSNHLFRGSLVYDPSQDVYQKILKIAESVNSKWNRLILQFAGDAADDSNQMSTVHGARAAGKRAAKELYIQSMVQAGIFLHGSMVTFDSD